MKFTQRWLMLLSGILILGAHAPGIQGASVLAGVLLIDDMERHSLGPSERNTIGASAHASVLMIDNMEDAVANASLVPPTTCYQSPTGVGPREPEQTNSLGAHSGIYEQEPSSAESSKSAEFGKNGMGLKIDYNKKNKGGPRGNGGFCGYFTLLHQDPNNFLDASSYQYLAFWVRGAKGNEKFKVGAADKKWALIGDSMKSREIGKYLPAGKITTEWQQAYVPLSDFRVDWTQMHSIAICFEGDLFEGGVGQGTVFIDELAFTKAKTTEKP